jgi:hypothetical protein
VVDERVLVRRERDDLGRAQPGGGLPGGERVGAVGHDEDTLAAYPAQPADEVGGRGVDHHDRRMPPTAGEPDGVGGRRELRAGDRAQPRDVVGQVGVGGHQGDGDVRTVC